MDMWSQVRKFQDGDSLNAKTLNIPIGQLSDRTDYLHSRISDLLSGGKLSSVVLTEVRLVDDGSGYPDVGNAVYLHQNDGEESLVASKAKASMSMYDDFKAAESAFTVGILQSKDSGAGGVGNVIVYGKLGLDAVSPPVNKSNILESGESFRPGRYYLSSNEAGKLTAHPNGPLVYVCSMGGSVGQNGGMSGFAVVNPQFLDMGTSHIHRTAVVRARPAGSFSTEGYLPIASTLPDSGSSSDSGGKEYLALRFGGTWTANRKIDYSFHVDQSSPDWPGGVWLHWSENGSPKPPVQIPAPDVEVPVSNGLTVRMSIPMSGPSHAFSDLSDEERTWETLTFPDAGKGWLDHEAFAVARGDDCPGVLVALRGNFGHRSEVSVEFPNGANIGGSVDNVSTVDVSVSVSDGSGSSDSTPAVSGTVSPYVWKSFGDFSLMVYKDTAHVGPASADAGASVSAVVTDEEPDAAYDYVIGMDPQLSNHWPPVPPKSAALIVNGVEMDNKALFPSSPTVSFGLDTIHWFEDDPGRRPWPEDIEKADSNPAYDKVEVLHWVRGFQGATGPVTSIQPKPGSPIKFYSYGTYEPANTGDLEVDLSVDFSMEDSGAPGYNVPKRSENGKLIAGPVVERIVGGPGISVVSKAGCPNGQGTVVVSLSDGSYRNQFSDIALENAEQAKIGMFPYVRLRGYSGSSMTSPSAFTAMMRVPTNMPEGRYAISLSASVFGENGFSEAAQRFACVKLSYNILPDFSAPESMMYSNLKSSLIKPDGDRIVNIPFGHSSGSGIVYNGFDPVFVSTEDSSLEEEDDVVEKAFGKSIPDAADFYGQSISPWLGPGYLVGVRISRAVTGQNLEAYTGPIGFMNLSWTLVQADVKDVSNASDIDKALDGVVIRAGTIAGMRSAVETIGETFGATVIK